MGPPDTLSIPSSSFSDPVSYTCTCDTPSGTVLLFYRYYAAPPALPPSYTQLASDLRALAAWYTQLTTSLNLAGKIRIASEGFNVTIAGGKDDIEQFMEECTQHWSYTGLGLEEVKEHTHESDNSTKTNAAERTKDARRKFFKPSPG